MSRMLPDLLSLLMILFLGVTLYIGLGEALVPLLISLFLTYLLLPLTRRFESRGIRKEVAVTGALGLGLGLSILFLFLVIPVLVKDLRSLLQALPATAETAIHRLESLAAGFGFELVMEKEFLIAQARSLLTGIPLSALKSVGLLFGRAFTGAAGLILSILNLLLIPVFFFHMLVNYEGITRGARELVPPRHRVWFDSFLNRANGIVSAYFRGQLLVAVILGVLYGTGFALTGLRFGFVIGLLTGLLNVIPYAGPLIGLGLATVMAISGMDGYGALAAVWAVFAVVQLLEGFVITPKIVGDRVGLNALETMLALIIGGNLGGFVGMLIAIPLAGIARVLFMESRAHYLKSALYTEKSP